MKLIKPEKLRAGDIVTTVSLSWGGAGDPDLLWRYKLGKLRLEEVFGLKVVEMEHTLKGSKYIYKHPEARAKDLMDAFKNPDIKAIFHV
jgi:muramoyltetrapeptide carboxypeptidase LdcA involved in peptidoglycan recycling